MTDDHRDQPLEDSLREAARAYHVPPPTPRDEMWAAIQARRGAGARTPAAAPRPRRARYPQWLSLALAASLVLAAGIAIGRLSRGDGDPAAPAPIPTPVARADTGPSAAHRAAAIQHLAQAEAFLTEFRAGADRPAEPQLGPWARDLLSNTRLLMDSRAADDAQMRTLLEELELVLAQIVQTQARRDAESRALIDETLEQQGVLGRLRAAVPAGALPIGS